MNEDAPRALDTRPEPDSRRGGSRPLLRRIGTTSVATIAGSAAGAVLPFVIAIRYTDRSATDAYFLAAGAVVFVASMLTVVLKGAVVPFAIEWLDEGPRTLRARARALSLQACGMATGLAVVAGVILQAVVLPRTDFDGGQRGDSLRYLLLLLPLPALMSWAAVLAGCHYATGSFGLPSWSEGMRSVGAVALTVTAGGRMGLAAVPVGLVAGECCRLAILRGALIRRLQSTAARTGSRSGSGLAFWPTAAPQLLSMAVVGLNPLIDRTIAARLGAGSVTVVELGEKLFFTPMVLLSAGLGIVMGTRWAHAAVDDADRGRLLRDFYRVQRAGLLVSSVTALLSVGALLLWGDSIRTLTHLDDQADMPIVFAVYVAGLPAALAASLGTRLFVAVRATRVFPRFAAVQLVANVVFDIVGAHFFGLVGIALASSLYRVGSATLYLALAPKAVAGRWAPRRKQ